MRTGLASLLTKAASGALLLAPICAASTVAQPVSRSADTGVPVAARPAAAVVDAFHQALERGDTNAALSHLADEALIFESGGVERGKKEYASHHLAADAAFSQAVPSKVIRRTARVTGGTAWVASEGRTTGTFKGKAVDRKTVETMILRRIGGAWKIVHIHWSSAAAATGGK